MKYKSIGTLTLKEALKISKRRSCDFILFDEIQLNNNFRVIFEKDSVPGFVISHLFKNDELIDAFSGMRISDIPKMKKRWLEWGLK